MIKKNYVKEKIKNGQTVFGIWNTIASPLVTDILASSGLDFVLIDFEHGPFDFKNISSYVNSCLAHDVSPLVRIPEMSEGQVLQALDQGAHGIIIPHIETKEDAKNLIDLTKYDPVGKRGFTPFTKAGDYQGAAGKSHAKRANDHTMAMALVESVKGLDNIEDIVKNEHLDVVFFGSYDISQSLGYPGDTRHPEVVSRIKHATEVALAHGKCVGAYLASTKEDVEWLTDMGVKFIVYRVDSSILRDNISNFLNEVKS